MVARFLALSIGLAGPRAICQTSEIDRYIQQAGGTAFNRPLESPGSIFSPSGPLANPERDLRAGNVDDLVTILVADRASAVTKGVTATSRKSSANYGVGSALGPVRSPILTDLLRTSGSRDLQGQGETSRENVLTTSLAARVTHVLPNGNMVVEGNKSVQVNGEFQNVRVRGIVRFNDISPGNMVRSDRLAFLEVRVDGRGVVNDAIRRPNFLYRILLGLMPF